MCYLQLFVSRLFSWQYLLTKPRTCCVLETKSKKRCPMEQKLLLCRWANTDVCLKLASIYGVMVERFKKSLALEGWGNKCAPPEFEFKYVYQSEVLRVFTICTEIPNISFGIKWIRKFAKQYVGNPSLPEEKLQGMSENSVSLWFVIFPENAGSYTCMWVFTVIFVLTFPNSVFFITTGCKFIQAKLILLGIK